MKPMQKKHVYLQNDLYCFIAYHLEIMRTTLRIQSRPTSLLFKQTRDCFLTNLVLTKEKLSVNFFMKDSKEERGV